MAANRLKFTNSREAIKALKNLRKSRLIKSIAVSLLAVSSIAFYPYVTESMEMLMGKLVIVGATLFGLSIGYALIISVLDISGEIKRIKSSGVSK